MSLVSPIAASPVHPRRVHRGARAWALGACAAFGLAAVLLVVLHVDRRWGGAVSPVTAMLSEYADTPGWWLWDLALAAIAGGSVSLGVALRATGILTRRATGIWLAVWCVAIGLVAVFSKDPQGGAVSLTGKLHLYATGVGCAALPITGLLLARQHRGHPDWHRVAVWCRRLALASIPFFLPFIVPFTINVLLGASRVPTPGTGLIERVMAMLELALLALLVIWAYRAATRSFAPAVPEATVDGDR